MRILVVEDETSLAKQLTSSIAEAGYAVDHAADGERADFLAQTEQYDAMAPDLGLHHRGRLVSQAELTEHIYAQDFDRDSNTVEVFIARLRRKLGASFIETVRGLGYRVE
jgi:DNA-binding response OmpR family regulator